MHWFSWFHELTVMTIAEYWTIARAQFFIENISVDLTILKLALEAKLPQKLQRLSM